MDNKGNDIEVKGFDSDGEPSIELQEDGSIQIMFNFMPPSYAHETEYSRNFEDFEEQLTQAIGCKVTWEDRELFIVEKPDTDTLPKLIDFLSNFEAQASYKNIERKLLGHAAFRLIQSQLKETVFKKLLQSGFHERLPRDGVSRTYMREINGCEQKFFFTYDSRYREYSCSLEMRVEAVEKIYFQFKGFAMSGMTERNTCTLRPNLEHLFPSVETSSYPQNIRDVDSTVANVQALVLDFGIPFFDNNKSLKEVEETLNGNLDLPIDARKNFINGQAIRGVILAKLAGNPKLPAVRAHYEKDMATWSEAGIENWNTLLEYLEKEC